MASKTVGGSYALGGGGQRKIEALRSAAGHAAFLLPRLKAGMSLLDAGCGAGTITLGLAEAVAPGRVVGIDLDAGSIEVASAAASSRRLANLVFRTGSVYELPFPEDSFDVVFSNAVLEHLKEPSKAVREFHRVLKRGGILGVRAPDVRGRLGDPVFNEPAQAGTRELLRRLIEHNGGNWYIGSQVKRLLREAAFSIEEIGASHNCFWTRESLRAMAQGFAELLRRGPAAEQLVELRWADRDELERGAARALAWAEEPDAFFVETFVYGIGRKV